MKSAFKNFFKTIAFLVCFSVVLYLVCCVLMFKYGDGITPIDHMYDLPEDTVDVLFLGSSHMGVNVDPSILWEEEGIASYNCWGSMQQVWNTYYYLNECLKYQNPKLVIMDVYSATFTYDYATYDNAVKNTLGLRMSRDKIEDIRVSVEDDYFAYFLLGLPTYHYRYSELSESDFSSFFWNKNTEIQTVDTAGETAQPFTMPDLDVGDETLPLNAKQEEYLIKIIELCQENDIPLVFVVSPYYLSDTEAMRFNEIGRIAEEYDIPYLNYSDDPETIGLDTQVDYCDLCHLMSTGIQKYTTFLGNYIKENYDIPDRRLDENHIWNQTEEEEESSLLYELDTKFYGGGQAYVDTGVQLYVNPYSSFTLYAEIDTRCDSEDKVWYSCYCEEDGAQRGIMLRQSGDTLWLVLSPTDTIDINNVGDIVDITVVKEGLHYKLYVDGALYKERTVDMPDSFSGTLLLGCQEDASGKRFRFSETKILDLQVYNGAVDDQTVAGWTARELPEPADRQAQAADSDAAFALSEQFIGDGYSSYLNTGLDLYGESDASWTLLTRFQEGCDSGAGVYFSCYAEDSSDYRGVMARRTGDGQINLLYGNRSIMLEVPSGSEVSMVIVKDELSYTVYLNGEKVVDGDVCETNTWAGNLLIGCQEDTEFVKMRFSAVTVYNFEVYNGVMSEEDILAWNPEHCPEPTPVEASPVDYTLPTTFLGDGSSAYVDTGVQLYDVADKNWTLEITFEKSGTGHLVTCFAENPSNYRGLIVTVTDDTTLSLTLGQTAMEVEMGPRPEQTLKIVKQGSDYTVYINGELAGTAASNAPSYDGTLLVGCAVDGEGNLFRFSTAKILSLTVTDEVE